MNTVLHHKAPSPIPQDLGVFPAKEISTPDYLESTYWWAYVRPWAVTIFEREWLIDLILWGNYRRLRDAALAVLGSHLSGRTLQVACVYGNLTSHLNRLVERSGGCLDVVDVLKVQLENLRRKIPETSAMRLLNMDSTALDIPDGLYDRVLLFFLLHEQPRSIRERTLAEALRVVKPGGTLLILDFAKPRWWNPLRYLWLPFLGLLEPFAPDLWNHEDVTAWLPKTWENHILQKQSIFGGLYQTLLIGKPPHLITQPEDRLS